MPADVRLPMAADSRRRVHKATVTVAPPFVRFAPIVLKNSLVSFGER
jgi:hypothetical protein